MSQKEFVNILNGIVEEAVPGDVNLWPRIQTRLKRQVVHPKPKGRWWPTTRLGWITLACLLGLMFSSVAYAAEPLVSRFFQSDPGLRQAEKNNLVQPLHLSQTIDGITITVDQAYADANRIAVGFTVLEPAGRRFSLRNIRLTHLPETELPARGGGRRSDGRHYLTFDAAAVQATSPQLDLQFVV